MLTRIYSIRMVTSEKICQSTEGTSKKPTHFCTSYRVWHEAEFYDEIQTKVLRVFFLAIHSHLYSFNFRSDLHFFKLTQPLTVSIVQLLYTVKEKGGKPDRKPYPLPCGLRNPYINLNSNNS
jgi:hypothetical protein